MTENPAGSPLTDLTVGLERAASCFSIRPGDPAGVIARSQRRTARRNRVVGAVAAVAVITSSAGFIRARSADRGTPLDVGAGVSRGSLGITWTKVDPASGLGMAMGLTADGPLYGLSTAPGERFSGDGTPPSRVVWRSEDGVEWTAVSTLGNDLYLSDLATRDGRVYAVGTAPAAAVVPGGKPVSQLLVGWSDNGARQWQNKRLPIDWETLMTKATTKVMATGVATGTKGTLAVALLGADLDVRSLLPAGVTAPNGWATTDAGVDLLGKPRDDLCPKGTEPSSAEADPGAPGEVPPTWCSGDKGSVVAPQDSHGVIRSYSWAELGVEGDLLLAARRQPIAFLAPPGSTDFERVALPDLGTVRSEFTVDADDDGFSLAGVAGDDRYGIRQGTLAVLQSPDGRSWKRTGPPAEAQWVSAVGRLGDRLVVVTSDSTGVKLLSDSGGGGWSEQPLSRVLDPDMVRDRQVFGGTTAFGPFGLAVHVVLQPKAQEFSENDIEQRILLTRDGQTWDDVAVDELVGERGASVTRIVIPDDKVVVTASLRARDRRSTDDRKQVVVVGTAG